MASNPYSLSPQIQEIALSLGLGREFGLSPTAPVQTGPVKRPGFKLITLPDQSVKEIPENPTEEEKYRISLELAQQFPDEYGSLLDPYQTLGGGAAEFFKGIPRGFASSLVGAAQGVVGLATPGVDTELETGLAAAQKYLEDESILAPEEPYKDFLASKLGAGLGSVATYAMPGGIAKALGASATGVAARSAGVGLAVAGGAGEQAQRIQQERELGKQITAGQEIVGLIGGAGIGATEMLPINRLFSKVAPETGSALLNIFSRLDKRSPLAGSVSDDIMRLTKGAFTQGTAEGLQEGLAGIGQNIVSNVAYDADIEIGESFMDDLMVGGGVGAIADVIVDAMGGRRTVANKLYRDKEEKLRRQRIDRFTADQAEEIRKQREEDAAKRGQPAPSVLMLPPPSAIPAAPTNEGIYTVSLSGNPDRFTRVTVFSSPDGKGGVSTMAYSPEGDGYYDITGELAAGRSVEDAVAIAAAGDLGIAKPSKEVAEGVAFGAVRKALSVSKDGNIPGIEPARILSAIQGGRIATPSEDSFIKVQPLGDGTFGLVDVMTASPVTDKQYASVNDAFVDLAEINNQNAAISAANVLRFTGLIDNNPAYRLAASLRSPKNRLVQKSVISAFLPKEKRVGMKDFYSPEEAKKLLGPKDFDEMMQSFAQITEQNDLLNKYVKRDVLVDPNFANKRTITASALTKLGNDKNLKIDVKDKAFKDYAKYWTGTENWGDMSNGQRAYLMTRIANTPAMPETIKFPNLFRRQYSRSQFESVLGVLGTAKDGKTPSLSAKDIQAATGLSDAASKQLYSDLLFSGRVKPVVPGKIQLIRSEQDYIADRKAKAAGLLQNETVEQAAARMRASGFTEDSVKRVEQQAKQAVTDPKTPTAEVKQEAEKREEAAVAQGADPQVERVATNFDKILADALNRYGIAKFVKYSLNKGEAKTRKLPSGQTVMQLGYFSPIKKSIVINIGDQLNDPNVSTEAIIDRIVSTVDHETIHAMREADMFTEQEWNTLSNFVRTAKINRAFLDEAGDKSLMLRPKGKLPPTTMLDEIRLRYAGKGLNEMQLVEEAVAESFRLWRKHGGKFAAGKPASLFQRIMNFIQSFATAWKGSGATSIDQIFSAVADGEIGARTPGLSVFNPDANATIRSLNFADQELAKVKKIVNKGERRRGPVKITQSDLEVVVGKDGAMPGKGSAVVMFDPVAVNRLRVPDYKSREKLIEMNIDDFLKLARPGYMQAKDDDIQKLLAEGKKFSSIPFLHASLNESGVLKVVGHEGRHRARALKNAGYSSMPVILRTMDPNPIRWSEQSKPGEFDYVESWPTRIEAQEGNASIPMPVSREESMAPYGEVDEESMSLEIPLSEAEEKRVNDYIDNRVRNSPKGYIPRFNPNAPKMATLAALKYEQDGKEVPFPDSQNKLLISEMVNEPIGNDIIEDNVRRHGKIKPEKLTPTQKALTILESWLDGGFKYAFDDFSRVFRKALVDRYNEFRRQESALVGTENEGMLLAETSVSAALGQLDRARGWVASAFNYGGIRWVSGANMITADPSAFEKETALGQFAGYIDVDSSVPGLLEIFKPLINGSIPNGMGQFKAYATFKRIQGFRDRAKQAMFELDNIGPDADPVRVAALKELIESAKKVRLRDNPSDERISQLIEEIDINFPQVSEAHKAYQEWNKTLIQFGSDTGILTEDLAEKWKDWGDYFPFYEEMEEAVMKGQGFRRTSSMTKADFLTKALSERAKDLEDADPFEMIAKNTFGIIAAGLKNVTANRVLRNSVLVGEARLIEGPNPAKQAARLRAQGSYIKSAFVDGSEVYYEISDPLLHESMMNYGEPTLNAITKVLAMPANILREMVTRDPGFVAANMLRDTLSSFVTSGTGYTPVIDTFKNFAMGNLDEFLKTGVTGGYDLSADPQDVVDYVKEQYRKQGINMKSHSITGSNAVMKMWDWLGDMSTRSDAATRMAVYNSVLARTGSEAAARLAAVEVINFSRRGSNPIWRVVTAAVPFLNARIQGLDVIYRSFRKQYSPYDGLEDRAVTQKRALQRGAMLAAITGVYVLLMQDNEEYKKARREVRDDNWLIPIPFGDGQIMMKIPIPFEIGMMFKAFPEAFLNLMYGDLDARGFRDSIVRQVNNSTSIDVTGFQIVKPLLDVYRNQNSFTKQDIVPFWVNMGKEAAEQFDERTTILSKELGGLINVSPMKLDYLVGGYGGSLGMSIWMMTDKIIREVSGDKTAGTRADYTDVNNIPVIRRFFYDAGTAGSRQQQEFYELRAESNKMVTTLNSIAKRGDIAEYYAYANLRRGLIDTRQEVLAMAKYLKRYRDTRDAIIKSGLSDEQTREYLEELEADKNLRLSAVPILRERGEIPTRAASAIFEVFTG